MQSSSDVVVVGQGAIGLTVARSIKMTRPDLSVTVIGPIGSPGAASPAAGAMLSCHGEVTKYTYASPEGRARFRLSAAAHSQWAELLEQLSVSDLASRPLVPVRDTYVILNGRSGEIDSDNFDAMLNSLSQSGDRFEFVTEVPGLDPLPDARPLRAVHLPDEGGVDSGLLLERLAASCRELAVTFVDGCAASVRTHASRVSAVRLTDGRTISCGSAVIAAGVFSAPLMAELFGPSGTPPLVAGSGIAYSTQRVMGTGFESVVRSVNRAGSCGLHVVPLGEGREYFGATNVVFAEPELRAHLGVCHFVADGVMDQLDQRAAYSRIDEVRVGNRPVSLDTFPLIGPTSVEGLVVLTGTYRDGLHMAPELARLTARYVSDGADEFPPEFRPERRPIETMSVLESVDEFVLNNVSSMFEGRTRLSSFVHHTELEQMFRSKAETVYERLGTTTALAPDILIFLALSRKNDSDLDAVSTYLKAVGQ